ncbi:hypothetical protein ACHMW5_13585 [Azospirillum melinis]|uniref:hypothetical protein n=1 Tax=Azospirillum melinis TaxID=328839 RepID=UPI0037577B29
MAGYYRMHRGWMDHPALGGSKEPFCRRAAWAWLIENALFADAKIDVGGQTVSLKRGQMCFAYRYLSEAWGWPLAGVQRFVSRLETDKMVIRATINGRMVLTVCNYDKYQVQFRADDTASDTPTDTAAIRERYTSDTKNKELKQDKENTIPPKAPQADELPPDGGEAGQDDLNETAKPDSKARKSKAYPESFERFWSVWPNDHMGRKQSAGKAGTFDAWKKACGRDEPERIIRGATVYAENYGKLRAKGSDRADQIPMPTTWLNQKRWDGFADPAPETQQPATPEAEEFQWTVYLKTFAQCGKWPANKGPKPGEPGCQAPADLVARFVAPPLLPTAQIIVYPQQQRVAQ